MANRTAGLCEICDLIPEEKIAVEYCRDCEERICSDCAQHHRVFKLTRNHRIEPIKPSHTDMPKIIQMIQTKCRNHEQECTHFCTTHDKVCCAKCVIADHGECSELCTLSEHIKNSKTLPRMEHKLQELDASIEHGLKTINEVHSSVAVQVQNFINKKQDMRKRIDTRLNAIEHNFMEELRKTEKSAKQQVQDISKHLFSISSTVTDLYHDMRELKKCGSEIQTVLGSRLIETKIELQRKKLESLLKDGLNQVYLKSSTNEEINNLLSTLEDFGSVYTETCPLVVTDDNFPGKKTHVNRKLLINDIAVDLVLKMNIPDVHNDKGIRGCTMSKKGEIIISDYAHKKLIFLNEDGYFIKSMFISFLPKDITHIDDNTIALSTVRGVKIIDINTEGVKNEIYTENYACGITHHNGSILLCEASKGVRCIDITNNNMYTLIKQEDLPGWCYLASDENNIYQTVYDKHVVICFTLQGKRKWEFKDESILKDPTGISVDCNSFIYVTCESSNSVIVISPDGKHGKKLLDETNELKQPWGINVDKVTNKIVVANRFGPAFVYHISKNKTT